MTTTKKKVTKESKGRIRDIIEQSAKSFPNGAIIQLSVHGTEVNIDSIVPKKRLRAKQPAVVSKSA